MMRQPDSIKAEIARRANVQTLGEIVTWLNRIGVPANYNQVRYYVKRNNLVTLCVPYRGGGTYIEQVRTYLNALIVYKGSTFTIGELNLSGQSWTRVSKRLHKAGLIAPTRKYAPIRWEILATKEELRAWKEQETQ